MTTNELLLVDKTDRQAVERAAARTANPDARWNIASCFAHSPLEWNGKAWVPWKVPRGFDVRGFELAFLKPSRRGA